MVVRMAMTAVWLKIDEETVVQALQHAGERLGSVEDEVVVDFSSVRRIDPGGLRVMEEFAGIADGKDVTIVLRGVSVDIYKVLKLMKLAPRFVFSN
jgi:anti-anti-sigma regulatory factor